MQLCIALSHTNFFMKEEANPWYNPSLLSNYPFGGYLIRPWITFLGKDAMWPHKHSQSITQSR